MAWIEVHQSLRDHRKILALADELDMPEAHVAGHMLYLWLWALDNAPDGLLPTSERIIEKAAGWIGASGALVSAMVAAAMLDRQEDGRLCIHDWQEYAGRLIEKRRADAERKRNERQRNSVQRTSAGHPRDGAGTVPNTTVPNHTPQGKSSTKAKRERTVRTDDDAMDATAPSRSPSHPSASSVPDQASTAATQGDVAPPSPEGDDKTAAPPARSAVPARVNPIWDALVELMDGHAPATKDERSNWGGCVKQLKEAGATGEEVLLRGARYIRKYDRERLTVNALVKHWSEPGIASDLTPLPKGKNQSGASPGQNNVDISAVPKLGSPDWDNIQAQQNGHKPAPASALRELKAGA